MPDDGLAEAMWVSSLASQKRCSVAAIVASCDLASDDAVAKLKRLKDKCALLRGIRYILDYDGPYVEGVRRTLVAPGWAGGSGVVGAVAQGRAA